MRFIPVIFLILASMVNPTCGHGQTPNAIVPRSITLTAEDMSLRDLARAISEQANVPLRIEGDADVPVTVSFRDEPFWSALETVAAKTARRVTLSQRGTVVTLIPATHRPDVAIDGPFRLEFREALTRRDFATGQVTHHLGFGLNWEPRLQVLRLDAYPELTATLSQADKREIQFKAADVRRPVDGATAESLVRLDGYTGRFEDLSIASATFRATVAERMIPFTFEDLTKSGATQSRDEVTATLKDVRERGDLLFVTMELEYPPNLPTFESFESWLTDNRMVLSSQDGKRERTTSDFQLTERGRMIRAVYAFTETRLADVKGWSLRYETPSPPREVTLRFDFED